MNEKELIGDLENPWHNVYWFARMIISNDKYVAIGKDTKLISYLTSSMRTIERDNKKLPANERIKLHKSIITNILEDRYKKAKAVQARLARLLEDLFKELLTLKDIEVFILTCEQVMIPLNNAIANIPSDDREFTHAIAKSYLDVKGFSGLATVVNLWDDLGVKGCLTAERTEVVKAFATLRLLLEGDIALSKENQNIVLTAFMQEFERRVGQKRKKRAGTSLEDVTSFLLSYFGIKSATAPDHFQADIEIDNWVKTKDGWLIGISCKRTLRERWKQVSSAESQILSRYKIKEVYHIITYDEDLSDDKLALLGGHRHVFYLPDESRKLAHASSHIGLKNYVRPISQLIDDLKAQV